MPPFTPHISSMHPQTHAFALDTDANPLLEDWGGRFGVPAVDRIKPEHFRAACARAFAAHAAEVVAIAGNAAAPTFANTIAALEASGEALTRTVNVFNLLAGAHNNDEILAIEREGAPVKAKHWDSIHMDAALFGRIERLHRTRDQLALSVEERRVLERYYLKFVRAGGGACDRRGARLSRQTRHHHLALEDRAVPPILGPARPAREGISRLDRARRRRRRNRQQADHRRDGCIARRARAAAGLSEFRALPAGRHHGKDAGGGALTARSRLGAGASACERGSGCVADTSAGGRQEFPARGMGLALLRGKAAQAALRYRRNSDQAVSAARAHHLGCVLHRKPPLL